ncbi:MAG: PEPxxWA-CTERM sorting domain-containing protein [Pseudomonadota bacterium]
MYKSVFGAALATIAFASPAAATEFFEDFENIDGVPTTGTGFVQIPQAGPFTEGPEPDDNKIELQYGSVAGDPAADGGRVFVELDTFKNSSMFVTLSEDAFYSLSFLYSPRPNDKATDNQILVLLEGISGITTLFDLTSSSGNTTDWNAFSTSFKGNVGDKLIFKAGGKSNSFGGYVDNIALSVPEPATWLLMIFGLGAVGASMRRRQKATARIQFA